MDGGWSLGQALLRSLPKSSLLKFNDFGLHWAAVEYISRDDIEWLFSKNQIIIDGHDVKTFYTALLNGIKGSIIGGNYVSFGYSNDFSSKYEYISPQKWLSLDIIDCASSSVSSNLGAGRFFGVTLFPALLAPNADELLAGMKLSDIIYRFVAGDIEVVSRHLDAPNGFASGMLGILGGGSRLSGKLMVPLSSAPRAIIDALIYSPAHITAPWHPEPFTSPLKGNSDRWGVFLEISAGLYPVAERLASLSRLVLSGRVCLRAIAEGGRGEIECEVRTEDLQNPSLRLCLASGDIWQEKDGDKRRLFHSVRMGSPAAQSTPVSGDADSVSKNKGGRPISKQWQDTLDNVIAAFIRENTPFESLGDLAGRMAAFAEKNKLQVGSGDRSGNAKEWLARNFPEIRNAVHRDGEI